MKYSSRNGQPDGSRGRPSGVGLPDSSQKLAVSIGEIRLLLLGQLRFPADDFLDAHQRNERAIPGWNTALLSRNGQAKIGFQSLKNFDSNPHL